MILASSLIIAALCSSLQLFDRTERTNRTDTELTELTNWENWRSGFVTELFSLVFNVNLKKILKSMLEKLFVSCYKHINIMSSFIWKMTPWNGFEVAWQCLSWLLSVTKLVKFFTKDPVYRLLLQLQMKNDEWLNDLIPNSYLIVDSMEKTFLTIMRSKCCSFKCIIFFTWFDLRLIAFILK